MRYKATDIAKELNISRSYLYYLRNTGVINVDMLDNKIIWNENSKNEISSHINKNNREKKEKIESEYKTIKINNRRYLGNKYKLLTFIKEVVERECKNICTVADIFAGTGVVASAFSDKKIITNDIMYSNYICHIAWLSNEKYSKETIIRLINKYNECVVNTDNYMSDNFANTYFSAADCRKIGFIREDIEKLYIDKKINDRERALLITSLLYGMDKIANTCGHYDAYRKGVKSYKKLELAVPDPEVDLNENNNFYNCDANELVKNIYADLIYIDPPYNSRQYGDAYHLLENVAKWEKKEVFGVARKMDRSNIKSDYCTQKATKAFEELIENINSKYILLSYNNMAEKGNDRSNAKISDDDIIRILSKKGTVKVFSEDYKAFTTGKSNIKENKERLFLCICNDVKKEIIPSALNYTGGKYKLLPQILPLFPQKVEKFVDLFCGGCNVGINVECNKVLFNDSEVHLIGLLNVLKKWQNKKIFDFLFKTIDKYNLSLSYKYGYEFYGCKSTSGLGKYNKEGYLKLRNDFNNINIKDDEYYLMLYLLIVYSFNNQIRFNKKGHFNLPVGKRDFNLRMQKKLRDFVDRIKNGDYIFTNFDFRNFDIDELSDKDFFYIDPPYLITCATYNEGEGWTEQDEYDLLYFIKKLDEKNIKFALSNVIEAKGKTNIILKKWIDENKFNIIDLDYTYSNSNYHKKQREYVTKEILVTNY